MGGKLRERFGAVDCRGPYPPNQLIPQKAKRFSNTCFALFCHFIQISISQSCALCELGNPQNLQKLGRHLVGKATVF